MFSPIQYILILAYDLGKVRCEEGSGGIC